MTRWSRGSAYVEIIVSIAMVGIIGTSLAPLFTNMVAQSQAVKRDQRLIELTDYVGQYVLRWAQFSPDSKLFGIDFFEDGTELESFTGERRINQLTFANTVPEFDDPISDHYKTIIQFWETDDTDRAVVYITVWYDTDLNNEIGESEHKYALSTIVTERR